MPGVGHFRDHAACAHFAAVYRQCMAEMPPVSESLGLPTSFGTVRTHRFDGPAEATPLVLLPGRNASTPMWRANLEGFLATRTVFSIDALGEAGLSEQTDVIADAQDQAQWFEDTLAGLGLSRAHVLGASIGGWAAVNYAARFPSRVASLTLLDPVCTFAPIPARTLGLSAVLVLPRMPQCVRRWFLSWVSGGAEANDSPPEARLIAAAMDDFVLRLPPPTPITDDQLVNLCIPVLAFLGGRSVMLDADRAARRARELLRHSQIEVYREASHAINGEYAQEINQRATEFWAQLD